jgi:hypothetical protein
MKISLDMDLDALGALMGPETTRPAAEAMRVELVKCNWSDTDDIPQVSWAALMDGFKRLPDA